MADLVLSVDVSSLADARRKLDGFQKAMNNLSVNRLASGVNSLQNSIRQLVEAQAKGTIGSNAYQRGLLELKRAYEQLGYSSQQATAAVRAYAAQLQRQRAAQEAARAAEELARAQAQAAARTRELRLRFQEGYAAFDRARKQMRDLREALRQGIITQDQYREALRRVREEQQRAGAGAGDLARRMNRTGVITQQAGYQMGDFIVQVQSGTNWMVAFGQQATQVAGTLTLLGGKWILIGSVLGVAIPLITAAGAAFMRTRGIAKTFSETLDELETAISNYKSAVEEASAETTELNVRFGSVSESMRPFLQDLKELERIKALNKLQEQFEKLEANSASFFERFGATFVGGAALQSELASQLGLTVDQYRELNAQVVKLKETENTAERIQAAENLRQIILASAGSVDNMTKEMRDFYENLLLVSLASGEVLGIVESTGEAEKRLAALRKKEQEEQFRTFSERFTQYQEEIALQREIAKFGRDSAQVQKLEREQALAAEIRRINELERAQEINEDQANILRESARSLSEIEQTTKSAADEAKRFSDNLVLGQQYLANAVRAGVASGAIPPQALNSLPQTAGERAYQDLMERRRKEYYANQNRESRSRGGGGRSGTPEFVSRVFGAELQQAIEQAQEDLRLYNQEVQMLDSALQAGLVTQQEYNSFVAQAREAYNQAQQGAYDYSSAMEQVESTAMRSMEGAFMSLIDGSKSASDAFRDMAREILSEAMRLLVIRPLINNLFGGGLGGGGGIFGGIFGRASGGSVMAGKPYLVGEHGPELVIPGRSGTVMNADLTNKAMGGGENVTVVNNFNFSANGDDSVKRIIAAEAPKIAALTQKQIVDQRRRGGQMRSVFG